jgi:hypothetical protein
MRTSSLDIQEEKNKEDQDNRILKFQMEDANKAIKSLTMELAELQKLVKIFLFILYTKFLFFFFLGNRISRTKTTNEFSTKSFITNAIKRLIF